MTRIKTGADQKLLTMTITSLTAFALTSVAWIVSANTQLPVYAYAYHTNSDLSISDFPVSEFLVSDLPVSDLSAPDLPASDLPASDNKSRSGSQNEPAITSMQQQLHDNWLKNKTLSILRNPESAEATEHSPVQSQDKALSNAVKVNSFLLAEKMDNDSQLPELQMQPYFVDFDAQRFTVSSVTGSAVARTQPGEKYAGVGFPHIETNSRADSTRYKPYRSLLSFSTTENGVIVPNVKCMGLSPESVAKRAKKYDAKIFELAVKHRVSASLVKAVVAKESCFNVSARSPVGAIGLMQLMPKTAQWLNVSNPENANQNLAAGVRYLAQLRKRFGSNELALAAYNAGPGNVQRYKGIPPFAETENYVKDVMHFYRGYVATTRFVNALNSFE